MTPAVDAASLHTAFLVILPRVELHGHIYFRHRRGHDRDEAIQEMRALAWQWFLRLHARGKDPCEFLKAFTTLLARAVNSGRRLVGLEKAKDVMNKATQGRHGFAVGPLPASTAASHERLHSKPGGQRDQDLLEEALRDNTATPPPEQASFRLDFPRWMQSLGERRRRIAEELLVGERTIDVAARYGISPARVSQLRFELCQDWRRFHGETHPV